MTLRYEWVQQWELIERLVEAPGIALGDGEEWFSLTIEDGGV